MADLTPTICGIVMPISEIGNYPTTHWIDVKDILESAISHSGFTPRLVSDSDDVGVIQKRIVENLYRDEILVCDVSGKNPNVMFELGMRLAFDKPTVVVKDDQTDYSFDTSPIEHITYPRDLRFGKVVEFKSALSNKLKATHSSFTAGNGSFLKSFGTFKVATLDTTDAPAQELLMDEIKYMRMELSGIRRQLRSTPAISNNSSFTIGDKTILSIGELTGEDFQALRDYVSSLGSAQVSVRSGQGGPEMHVSGLGIEETNLMMQFFHNIMLRHSTPSLESNKDKVFKTGKSRSTF